MSHRLPVLVLAWTLALLAVPALASACTGTNDFTGAVDSTWETPGNWSTNSVPTNNQGVCIPTGANPTINASGAEAGDLLLDAGASLTVTGFGDLTVGGGSTSGNSTIAGSLIDDGTLTLASGTMKVTKGLTISGLFSVAGGALELDNGIDASGGGTLSIAPDSMLQIVGSTAADPTVFNVGLKDDGLVTNDGPVQVSGGGTGAGDWKLGSGDPAPTVTIDTLQFSLDGTISDRETGGLGKLVINSMLSMQTPPSGADIHLYVDELDVVGTGATVDFTPSVPIGLTTGVAVSNLNVNNAGGGGLFEVDAPLDVYQVATFRDGAMLANNGPWNLNTFHWGGGELAGATSVNVAGLDMNGDAAAGDSGSPKLTSVTLNVNGVAFDGLPTFANVTNGLDMNGGTLHIASGTHFWMGDDSNITQSSASSVINDGIIEKRLGTAAGSTIAPPVKTTNGELWVGKSTKLTLATPPDTLSGGVLSGTYILDGELDIGGAVNALAGQFQFGASGRLLNGATDVTTTLTSNASGSTITVEKAMTFTQNFVNSGTIDIVSSSLTAQGTYTQSAGITKVNANFFANLGATINGGTLQGTGTITGDVTNAFGGTVAPGNSPGILTITGNFSNAGVLLEEVNGPTAGTDYDQINVTGTATLGGQLIMQRTGAYVPPNGQAFDAITASNMNGQFATITQFPASSDTWFEPSYGATTFRLAANSVSIGDATVNEGEAAAFTISLGQASNGAVSVDWATQEGTATAGSDYTAANGTVTFAPGETTKTVVISTASGSSIEPNENFAVNLSNPVGTRVRKAQGVGTINDTSGPPTATPAVTVAPGDIDGFAVAPPPVQGKKVNVEPVSGKVLVKLPGAKKFVLLPDVEQIPVRSIVDATKGVVRLYSVGKGGRLQSALFYEGVFEVTQKVRQALTTLTLVGGSFAACPSARSAATAAKKKWKPSSSVRHLWGSGKGQFQTKGRYAAAAIRGTKWLTDDHCNGTLIRVAAGAVTVRDLTLKKTFALKAPKKYLAPATKPRKRG